MIHDPLYFPRTELAKTLVQNLQTGISHAFTLFAPRRMGKTQFLLNDITPVAEQQGFKVFYFSFMNESPQRVQLEFRNALLQFCEKNQPTKLRQKIKSIEVFGVGIEKESSNNELSLVELFNMLAEDNHPTLMLLDEVQELSRMKNTEGLVRALRTGLDMHKPQIKVIFTGSSTNGLRALFNDSKAPFFHFSHSIDFPHLGRDFTDFLAQIYHERTQNSLDPNALYQLFERLYFTPLYIRAIVQDMIINPSLSLMQATEIRLAQIHSEANYHQEWEKLSALEQFLLLAIAQGESGLYKADFRQQLADKLGVQAVSTSTIQTKIKKLERQELVTKASDNSPIINSQLFKQWLVEKG